ncbi:MAG: recombinase family protein [Hyphomicrobiaceae bacterium]|nr:recombinase family protein [Hyphomicrobiaceae bacterium]
MAAIGYARVSTNEQNLHSQEIALGKFALDRLFCEKQSGLDGARPVLAECLRYVRQGDTLYVTRADRLARSTLDLLKIVADLKARGVKLIFTEQPELSTDTAQGELMLTVLAGIAKFETRLRAERQAEGIKAAQSRGVKFGRKAKIDAKTAARCQQLREEGLSATQIGERLALSRASVYRALGAE